MVDLVSLSIAMVAVIAALLSWWESRRQGELFESMAKSLAYIARSRRATTRDMLPSTRTPSINQMAEERRRLKVELEREKENWRRQKDIAKALAWLIEGLDDGE